MHSEIFTSKFTYWGFLDNLRKGSKEKTNDKSILKAVLTTDSE